MLKFIPLILVTLSNITYHISSKTIPVNINPFFGLYLAYAVALLICLLLALLTKTDSFFTEIEKMNFASIFLGLAIVGVEAVYLLMYRKNWDISRGSVTVNILTAIFLLFIGIFYYKETMSFYKMAGVILCIIGVYFLVYK